MRSVEGVRSFRALLVLAVALVAAGCENAAMSHNDGSAGAGDASLIQVGSCLRALFAACRTDGVCRTNDPETNPTIHYCFASGAQADFTHTGTCVGDGRAVLVVRKPDGSPCYTSEVTQGYMCESETFTWRDPSGQVIATGHFGISTQSFQCATGGERFSCTDDTQCNLGSLYAQRGCQPGGCP